MFICAAACVGAALSSPAQPHVAGSEQSAHFASVARHLELGGTHFSYTDVEGQFVAAAENLRSLLQALPAEERELARLRTLDTVRLVTVLGFDRVAAIGLSSVQVEGGYRNTVCMHIPGGRAGLLEAAGGPPAPCRVVELAPADADLAIDLDLDLGALATTLQEAVLVVLGPEGAETVEAALDRNVGSTPFRLRDLLERPSGRLNLVARVAPTRFALGRTPLAQVDVLVRVEGAAWVHQTLLDDPGSGLLRIANPGLAGDWHAAAGLIPPGLTPLPDLVVGTRDGDLLVATTTTFARECLDGATARLAEHPAYRDAVRVLGEPGNGLVWATPAFATWYASLGDAAAALVPPPAQDTLRNVLHVEPLVSPLVIVRTNLETGIVLRSYAPTSHRTSLLLLGNPIMSAGLGAAMAIPAFQRVRANSQERVVMNNLRMLSAAADQFMLETGREEARYVDIVGPGTYIEVLQPAAGEDYSKIIIRATDPKVQITLPDGRVVTCPRF